MKHYDLLACLSKEPSFGLSENEMSDLLDPTQHIGRCAEPVEALTENQTAYRRLKAGKSGNQFMTPLKKLNICEIFGENCFFRI